MNNKKRNLITGGSGFLGSHLAKELLARGEEVICLDNFFTGSKTNIKNLFKHNDFEFIRHDVTEPIKLEVDNIWHLAAPYLQFIINLIQLKQLRQVLWELIICWV